jgi:hypothetical protein
MLRFMRYISAIICALIMGMVSVHSGWASSPALDPGEAPQDGATICSTRLQLRHPGLCDSLGPAGQLAEYAQRGIYPDQPLPAAPLDAELSYVPFQYLKVDRTDVNVFSSLEKALRGGDPSRSLGTGFIYVSYTDRYDVEGKVVYQLGPGEYIRGDHVSRISTPTYRGLVFSETPKHAFGWIMTMVNSYVHPGYDQPMTKNVYYRYQVVQIYDVVKVGDFEWYMVGPGEWIEQRQIAVVWLDIEKPLEIQGDRWISVNLYEQTIAAYENDELVFASLVSSGLRGWWTRPGIFQVYKKYEADGMQGAFEADRSDFYYLEDVPWVLYYDEDRALHGAYWHNNFGWQQSHGCVNLSPADANWLYDWAVEGTWVYVWDPSGETPTDPDVYKTS